jgi:hypothetical protein
MFFCPHPILCLTGGVIFCNHTPRFIEVCSLGSRVETGRTLAQGTWSKI